ncbi:MAG: M18 family aminopeptidase [Chlamydiales bacterium]|nr:M18 family aminopeptidase [Chlamydiales bacterium]
MQIIDDFISFIRRSPTVWHAAKEISGRLLQAGFLAVKETDSWQLESGKAYFVLREGALIAFRLPSKTPDKVIIAASHSDSPALKIKPHPDLRSHDISQLSTEVYGAPLLHTWLDRDLCLAGRVITKDLKQHLVHLTSHPLIIPSIPPHLERTLQEKGLHIHKQDHLKPIFSLHPVSLFPLLAEHLKVSEILSADLFLIPQESPALLGQDQELLASYRLDNLSSAYSSLQALIETPSHPHTIQLAVFWDHEEIGSTSYTGANSNFLTQTLQRIFLHTNLSQEDTFRLAANSLCLSIDVAHGFHPNFSDKFDSGHASYLGKGIALKFHADQKYATSAHTAASIIQLCKTHNIPYQLFASRSDIPSGSTVGSFLAANLGIPTIDLGVPIWAMHSIRETLATQDQQSLSSLLLAAFNYC